jgi:hypothetical protein
MAVFDQNPCQHGTGFLKAKFASVQLQAKSVLLGQTLAKVSQAIKRKLCGFADKLSCFKTSNFQTK